MKLAVNVGYWGGGAGTDLTFIEEAERLGYSSVWVAEAWGSDAVTVLSWIAARTTKINVGAGILQMPARTPAMTAMTAVTLNELSGGRFLLGLGLSGPQVVEGWHGVAYGKPLGKTREYVSIVRTAVARKEPLVHHGSHYEIPYAGDDATGLGKPLKLMTHPSHPVPIYLAAIGPKNVSLTAEIADGWLPIFYSPQRSNDIYGPLLQDGFAKSGEDNKAERFDTVASLQAIVTDDVDSARNQIKPTLALYLGGMGAKGKNFYNDLACRYGYEKEAAKIQDLYLSGKKMEAIHSVPDALVDELSLIGTKEMIRDRLEAWQESPVTTLALMPTDLATLRTVAE
ncbi:MAG: LLM class F420-dependent oxidoreductase, partial [Acidimicrobiia bacterium]|nr:LLM class F420-dependent oxidoreductase [Acidimicrobiia bacterium]MDX2466937.1 LLM class F420-dependent oxidoreductase [Acidimicrobiia bacterium]